MTGNKRPRVWVVLADGEHARVVSPVAAKGQFATVLALDSANAHKRSSDIGTDRPGRVFESASTTRHAVTPRSDPHVLAKRQFAVEVGHLINEHDQLHAFDRLVLVAPGHALHDLREALAKPAAAKLVGSLTKDLLKVADHDLTSHLAEWWVAPEGE